MRSLGHTKHHNGNHEQYSGIIYAEKEVDKECL